MVAATNARAPSRGTLPRKRERAGWGLRCLVSDNAMRKPPLILVVDDVADNVEILQLRLESQGYEVIAAATARRRWRRSATSFPTSCCSTS